MNENKDLLSVVALENPRQALHAYMSFVQFCARRHAVSCRTTHACAGHAVHIEFVHRLL